MVSKTETPVICSFAITICNKKNQVCEYAIKSYRFSTKGQSKLSCLHIYLRYTGLGVITDYHLTGLD